MVLLEQERAYSAAITVAQRLHEATYRQLMRLRALSGDRAAALRTYHTCASRLERELGIAPGKATRQVYERLMQQDATPGRVPSPPASQRTAPLIGRRAQWQQLQSTWHPEFHTIVGDAHDSPPPERYTIKGIL